MRIRLVFAWYDLWIGAFLDRPKARLFIFPLPMIGVMIQWRDVEDSLEALRREHDKAWRRADFWLKEATSHQKALGEILREAGQLRLALWNLGVDCTQANIDQLKSTADEIDCGSDCDHGSTEWDTNAFNCSRIEDGTCAFERASALRDIAMALEVSAKVRAASQSIVEELVERTDG